MGVKPDPVLGGVYQISSGAGGYEPARFTVVSFDEHHVVYVWSRQGEPSRMRTCQRSTWDTIAPRHLIQPPQVEEPPP